MIRNYLIIAFRNIFRQKVFSFINIAGLALGMACSLLIALWVKDEISFDRFHANRKQIYQVMANLHWGDLQTNATTPGPLAEALRREVPEIKHAVKMTEWDIEAIFTVDDKREKETRGGFASADFFQVFSFPLVEGNPRTVLTDPNSIVISQTLARKYFGESSAIGKPIRLYAGMDLDLVVSGVMQDVPRHSSMQFNFVIPFQFLENMADYAKTWGNFSFYNYVLLHPEASQQAVEPKINQVLLKNRPGTNDKLFLHPLTDIYLHTRFENGKAAGGRIEYVRLFSAAAVFVLLIACINFMNLSTARSTKRAKEVGIRKVVGAARRLLITQFISESILLALIAIVFSVFLVELLLPAFNTLTGKNLSLHFNDPSFLLSLAGIAIVTGIVAGSYPALYLSALEPVSVLKGQFKMGFGSVLFRKGLVVFQFVLSISLIVGTLIVYRQIDYVKNSNLGLDRQNVIHLPVEGELREHLGVFKQELEASASIQSVTAASENPMSVEGTSADLDWPGKMPDEVVSIAGLRVGYDFLRTLNIQLKEGRDFSPQFVADTSNYIINEAAARMMRLSEPVGQEVSFWRGKGKIVGVVKDFHMASLHETIKPLILALYPKATNMVLVKTSPGKTSEAIAILEKASKKYNPQYPFEYHFLDETFEQQYKSEMLIGELATYAAVLAVFISCLGLFGLAAFTAEQRTKEIGIRKVLGASVFSVVNLLSKDFLKLVLIAFIIATPIAWYMIYKWLENFAYRVEIGGELFLIAGIAALLIALLTVSYQSIKAALANPVKSLRSE